MRWLAQLDIDWQLGLLLLLFDVALVAMTGLHVLLHKRKTASALLWLIVVTAIPLGGSLLYVILGYDRHGRRATAKELASRAARVQLRTLDGALRPSIEQGEATVEVEHFPDALDPFGRLLARLGRYRAVDGNSVELLDGGDAFFSAAVQAIEGARSTVLLETYIFETDEAGRRVLAALSDAAKRGVACRVLYDAIGSSSASGSEFEAARREGVKMQSFDQRSRLRGRFQINLRNHRKILVVDGAVGFTGSANLSALHLASTAEESRSEDLHFRVRGPVVFQLSGVFAEDWYSTTGESITEALFFPEVARTGTAVCRALPSGPDGDHGAFHELLVAAIHGAQQTVRIVTPYFVPSDEVTLALRLAAKRDVRVEVLIPRRLDHRFIRWASNSFLMPMLVAGVEVRRRPGAFLHAKVLIIDDIWALVGSSNIDPRSFFLNYELNLGIVGRQEVAALGRWVRAQWDRGVPVERDEFERRGIARQAWENFWGLFAPLL